MKKVFIRAKEFNGFKNVLFVVAKDSYKINYENAYKMYAHKGDEFAKRVAKDTVSNYEVLGTVDVIKREFSFEGKDYTVFSDYSVRVRN